MSTLSVGYAIDLAGVSSINEFEAREFLALAIDDLSQGRKLFDDDVTVLEICLGLRANDGASRDLAAAFKWLCRTFGHAIDTQGDVYGTYNLELPTKLIDGIPPFGFQPGDENISHLTRNEVAAELSQFASCVAEAVNEALAVQRRAFLCWLSYCNERRTDLVVIQS